MGVGCCFEGNHDGNIRPLVGPSANLPEVPEESGTDLGPNPILGEVAEVCLSLGESPSENRTSRATRARRAPWAGRVGLVREHGLACRGCEEHSKHLAPGANQT